MKDNDITEMQKERHLESYWEAQRRLILYELIVDSVLARKNTGLRKLVLSYILRSNLFHWEQVG